MLGIVQAEDVRLLIEDTCLNNSRVLLKAPFIHIHSFYIYKIFFPAGSYEDLMNEIDVSMSDFILR